MTARAQPLIDVDVRLEQAGGTISIRREDRCLIADSPGLECYARLSRALGTQRPMIGLLRRSGQALAQHELTAEVRVAGRPVAECGFGVRNWLLRLVGLPHVRLRRPGVWLRFLLTGGRASPAPGSRQVPAPRPDLAGRDQ